MSCHQAPSLMPSCPHNCCTFLNIENLPFTHWGFLNTPALTSSYKWSLAGLLADHFSTFETRVLTWYTWWCIAEVMGASISVHFAFRLKVFRTCMQLPYGIVSVEGWKLNREVYDTERRLAQTGPRTVGPPGRTGWRAILEDVLICIGWGPMTTKQKWLSGLVLLFLSCLYFSNFENAPKKCERTFCHST